MPTLRSQSSKPSSRKKKEEEEVEEMPPPAASRPPKTRATRASAEVEELSTSPAPSTKSSRSKARPKKKAAPVEVVEEVSPPPSVAPSTKSTRSGRQKKEEDVDVKKETKTATAKQKEPKSKKAAKPAEDPVVLEEPEQPKEKEVKEKAKRPARTAAGKKKVKKPEPEPEVSSLSDDISDEDMVRTRGNKLTREKMHKQYVTPLKSAIDAGLCDSVPKFFNKLKKNAEDKKSEEKFQKLLALGKTDLSMPPPPAPGPAPKAKRGRAKRVRTPEKEKCQPADAKAVPESFNFAEETRKEQPPVKKMILDQPETPQEIKRTPKAVSPPPKIDVIADEPCPSDSKKEEEEMDIFESSAVVETEDAIKTEEVNKKKLSEKVVPEPASEPKKADLAFDATFTFDTPPSKPHLPAGNATFTPEQDTDTPKSEAADKTIVISNKNSTSAVSGKESSPGDLLNNNHEKSDEQSPCSSVSIFNSTYVVPSIKKNANPSALNVTVCLKSETISDVFEIKPQQDSAKSFMPQGGSRFMCDSPLSRTFCKEPPSLAMVVEEEDEQPRQDSQPKEDKKSDKLKARPLSKTMAKGTLGLCSPRSSSNSSMKSASSQPCLTSSKLSVTSPRNGPVHGSVGKLYESPSKAKHSDLDEAEKRRQEFLQQKVENSKKKNAEWAKKTAELKRLEDEKRMKEKQKFASPVSVSALKKQIVPILGKTPVDGPNLFAKPKNIIKPTTSKYAGSAVDLPRLSKNPFHIPLKKTPIMHAAPVETEVEDESFKSAQSSLLEEGHLSTYDITMYEDLSEDGKHRENKTLPSWASDRESLKAALFSMVMLPEYEKHLPSGFPPKPDKRYKLFPSSKK